MRIAISATGPTLDAEVDSRFGRCQYFTIADPEKAVLNYLNGRLATGDNICDH